MGKLDGKVAIVTGGGKGLGFGVSTAFAKEGAKLVLTGRTEGTLLRAKQELEEKYGAEVICIPGDGADEENVKLVVKTAVDTFGRLDIVVNNAQASKSGVMLADHTKADFDLAVMSGLYAAFFYMREAYPHLKETKGSVINFASGAGFSGKPGQSSYAAAKEGIRGMSRAAATEWGPDGINVNIVAPLAMTEQLAKWKEEYPDVYEKTISSVPMGRFADPESDIGRVCVFLASEDAAFITGETISVMGGVGLRP